MDNLDILVKSLNKLENYTAKYIYKKYIEADTTVDTTADTTEETPPDPKFKYNTKPASTEAYKLYLDRIFSKERKHIIKQNDITAEDLENMTEADEEYEKNPNLFHRQKNTSYPDIKRCSYIRKHKHKLMRCKNSIINDEEEMCTKHEESPNMYWAMYIELLEKMHKE